jgi:DNA-binding GntR family transcriptional regulator
LTRETTRRREPAWSRTGYEDSSTPARPPSSWLRQNEVVNRFGVSTTPVREAFAELARDGIVRLDAHRGATVFQPSVDGLIEIYQIRSALEPLATRFAVAHASN